MQYKVCFLKCNSFSKTIFKNQDISVLQLVKNAKIKKKEKKSEKIPIKPKFRS